MSQPGPAAELALKRQTGLGVATKGFATESEDPAKTEAAAAEPKPDHHQAAAALTEDDEFGFAPNEHTGKKKTNLLRVV